LEAYCKGGQDLPRAVVSLKKKKLLAPPPTRKTEGSNIYGRPQLFIQNITNYHPVWWPFLHPQPEDATSRGDMDPLITGRHGIPVLIGARHNLIMCPVKILSGFIPVHLDCSLLLHSRRQVTCVHVVYTCTVQVYKTANAAVEAEGTPDVESERRL
jgi:hypothetical protein